LTILQIDQRTGLYCSRPSKRERLVEILRPGCANFEKVYQNAFEAVEQLGLDKRIRVVKVTDIREFAKRGVSITPGLVIDGKVVSTGKVLEVDRIMEMLEER
jgi:small redox-active disulfide protein 2